MIPRIITGIVGIPIFLGLLYLGNWPLLVFVAGLGLIGFYEYLSIWRVKQVKVAYLLGSLASLALIFWAGLAPDNVLYLGAILTATVLGVLTWVLLNFGQRTVVDGLITISGVLYVGFLLSHLILLRGIGTGTGWDTGLMWVTFAFLATWAADTCAYFVGMAIGKRKLAPKISPGKSIEGALAGSAGATLVGWFIAPLLPISPWYGALIGILISMISVLGDLSESALKRHVGVKDSGRLLPGHGGILDRLDSSLFVLPFVYYIARLFFVG